MPSLGFAERCQEKPPQSHLYFGVRNSASLVHALGCAPSYHLLSVRYERVRAATPRGWSQPGAGRGAASPAPRKVQTAGAGHGATLSTTREAEPGPLRRGLHCSKASFESALSSWESIKQTRMGKSDFLSSSIKNDCEQEERESEVWRFHTHHIC